MGKLGGREVSKKELTSLGGAKFVKNPKKEAKPPEMAREKTFKRLALSVTRRSPYIGKKGQHVARKHNKVLFRVVFLTNLCIPAAPGRDVSHPNKTCPARELSPKAQRCQGGGTALAQVTMMVQ